MERSYTLENINEVAKEFWRMAGNKTVFAFQGEMGTGKTTFIHALCDAKGVRDMVGSPTFSIINEYGYIPIDIGSEGIKKIIFHLDLYRVKDEEEAQRAGVEDVLYSGNTCLVEWPEKAPGIFPEDTLYVQIELVDNDTRRLKIANI